MGLMNHVVDWDKITHLVNRSTAAMSDLARATERLAKAVEAAHATLEKK